MAPGRKDHAVSCGHRRAPATEAVSAALAAEPCLDGTHVSEIARILRRAEDVLGLPVEIEWALDEERVTLLQARPLHLQAPHVPDEIWLQHPRLNGHPAGVGWGAGRAVVINCECEMERVAPGDVLVTRVAGPALASGAATRLRRGHRTRRQHVTLRLARARARDPDGARRRRRDAPYPRRRAGRRGWRRRDRALDVR